MILSLTLNPAVDKTIFVRGLAGGEVNRVERSQVDPGGKGINVSRVVHRLGHPTIALGFLAGNIGHIASRALDEEGVAHRFAWVPGETRLNVVLMDEATGQSTSFYDHGPAVDRSSLDALCADVYRWLAASRVLVAAGSLPPGVPDDIYSRIIGEASRRGVLSMLDADGETLRLGLAGRPDIIKPNVEEAQKLLGRELRDTGAVVAAARELCARGMRAVIISMAGKGSICATGDRILHAVPPAVERRSTVGSGDSLVAGLATVLARGGDVHEGLRLGTAAGAATAMTPGTQLGSLEEIERLLPDVQIREVT